MTREKTPVWLTVVIKATPQQWFVAGIAPPRTIWPLIRSEIADLDRYLGQPDDEQLSFLRHRLSGAMQRGVDRLWAREAKAARIVLIADDDLPSSAAGLLPRLAEHFHVWMTKPPVSFYRGHGAATIEDLQSLECLAGPLDPDQSDCLQHALPHLFTLISQQDVWEVIPKPKTE